MEKNKIYNTDCVQGLKGLNKNSIDLVITSPPYDNLRDYDGYVFDFENTAKELYRVLKPGGVIVWVVGDATVNGSETGTSFKQALYFISLGLNLHDTMIYQKNSATFPANEKSTRYTQIFEYMFIFSKGKPKSANLIKDKKNKWSGHKDWGGVLKKEVPEYSARNNIWIYATSFNDKTGHPAPFPEKLAEDHIISWSEKGDVVLDPFAGSGTTLKMAYINNRDYIGFEISEKYTKSARKRLSGLQRRLI